MLTISQYILTKIQQKGNLQDATLLYDDETGDVIGFRFPTYRYEEY